MLKSQGCFYYFHFNHFSFQEVKNVRIFFWGGQGVGGVVVRKAEKTKSEF